MYYTPWQNTLMFQYIHLPVQSEVIAFKIMNRLHTREEYFQLIDNIRKIIPNCAISQDIIAGLTETEEDHRTIEFDGLC